MWVLLLCVNALGSLQCFVTVVRPRNSTTYVDAAYFYTPNTVVSLSVCHTSDPCKNSWTDPGAVWVEDLGGRKESCVRWGSRSSHEKGNFEGEGASQCKVWDTLWSSVQKRLNQSRCCLGYWCHLANTIKPSICCGDAASCQITLTTCSFMYNWFWYWVLASDSSTQSMQRPFQELVHGSRNDCLLFVIITRASL